MSDDEDHTVADQLVCGGDRLVGVAEVVRGDEPNLVAEDAAGGVESATASAVPRCICSPNQAFFPVSGPAIPIRTSARAGPPSARRPT